MDLLVKSQRLVRRIEECFPTLKIARSKRVLTGWDNIVLDVNGKYIFRFPRFPVSEEHLRKELRILPFLGKHLSVAVPNYRFVWRGVGRELGWFAGYPKIAGEPLTVGGFRLAWTENLSGSFARFVHELHNLDTTVREVSFLPRRSPKETADSIRKTRSRIRKSVYPLLSSSSKAQVERFWAALLEDFDNSKFDPVLVHGDLTSRNILLDRTGRITGILDWADTFVGDPALDFAGLFEVNKALGERVLRHFGDVDTGFRNRIDWYVRMIPFYEILWGIDQGSEKFKTTGLKRFQRRVNTRYVENR